MPLILLGLIVLLGLLAYAVARYIREFHPSKRDVQEKVATVFRQTRGETFRTYEGEEDFESESKSENGENKTIMFPTDNIETEKHKRNIH